MLSRAIRITRLLSKNQINFHNQPSVKNQISYKPIAQFGFFSNLFLSKDQKHIQELSEQLFEVSNEEKIDVMNQIIKSKQEGSKKQNYDHSHFDKFVLAECYMNAGKPEECNAILKQLESKSANSVSVEEAMARRLYINPSNTKLIGELEKLLKNPNDLLTHSIAYGQMVLGKVFLEQKNYEKSEENLKKAIENVDILLEGDKDNYVIGCKFYVKVVAQVYLTELLYNQRRFEELNKVLQKAMDTWERLVDNYTDALGYQICNKNPLFFQMVEMQIRVAEFFSHFSDAVENYQTIILNLDDGDVTPANSLYLIKLKLRLLNCLIHDSDFSDSKRLLKEISKLITKFQPENKFLQAEYLMQEIHLLHKSKKLGEINAKITEASQYCLQNKILNLSYARILLTFLKLNVEQGESECGQIIQSVEQLLKSVEDVPVYLQVDFYFLAAQYSFLQKDPKKISQYLRDCITLLKCPPAQQLSTVQSYYIMIGYYMQLNLYEEAKSLRKEAQEYVDSITLQTPGDQYKISLLFLEVDESFKLYEEQNKGSEQPPKN